jgi:hypothetical protein
VQVAQKRSKKGKKNKKSKSSFLGSSAAKRGRPVRLNPQPSDPSTINCAATLFCLFVLFALFVSLLHLSDMQRRNTLTSVLKPRRCLPHPGAFGSAGVGILYGPGFFNWDSTIGKKFYLTEKKYFDFRAEFFNFTNAPNFNGPDHTWTLTSTTFGQITSTINSSRNMEFALKFHL